MQKYNIDIIKYLKIVYQKKEKKKKCPQRQKRKAKKKF